LVSLVVVLGCDDTHAGADKGGRLKGSVKSVKSREGVGRDKIAST
jgi:hypothetical protein